MSYVGPNCNSSSLEDYIWCVSGRKGRNNWWCAICGKKNDWKQPNSLRPLEDKEESQCRTCAQTAIVSLWKTSFGGSVPEKPQSAGAQFVEKSMTGGNRTGFLVVETGAKVFKAHAVPQGLCENLINALKLLANQQEDGDGLLQNIVTNLGKGSRTGLTEGLREFIKIDKERAR